MKTTKKNQKVIESEKIEVKVDRKAVSLVSGGEEVERVVDFPNCPRSIFITWSTVMDDPDILRLYKGHIKPIDKFFEDLLSEFATRNKNLEEMSDVPAEVREFLSHESDYQESFQKQNEGNIEVVDEFFKEFKTRTMHAIDECHEKIKNKFTEQIQNFNKNLKYYKEKIHERYQMDGYPKKDDVLEHLQAVKENEAEAQSYVRHLISLLNTENDKGKDNLLEALQKNLVEAAKCPSKLEITEKIDLAARDILANIIDELDNLKGELLLKPKEKFIKDWTNLDMANAIRKLSQDSMAAFLPFDKKKIAFSLKLSKKFQTPHELPLTCLCNIDNELLATGSKDGSINLIKFFEGEIVSTLLGHCDAVTTMSTFKCSELQDYESKKENDDIDHKAKLYLVSGSAGLDSSIKIWDPVSGEIVRNLEGHDGTVTAIIDLGDECTLASGGIDGNIVIWNALKCEAVQLLEKHDHGITAMQLMRNGKRFAAGGNDGIVTIWGIQLKESGKGRMTVRNLFFERSFEVGDAVLSLNACQIDTRLLLIGCRGLVQVFNVENGETVNEIPTNSLGDIVLIEDLHAEPYKENFVLINTMDEKYDEERGSTLGTGPSVQLIQANDWHLKLARIGRSNVSSFINPLLYIYDVI